MVDFTVIGSKEEKKERKKSEKKNLQDVTVTHPKSEQFTFSKSNNNNASEFKVDGYNCVNLSKVGYL